MSTNNNHCSTCGPAPQVTVAPPPACAGEVCIDIIATDCVRYKGPALTCNGEGIVASGDSLTEILQNLITLTCTDACCTVPEVTSVANQDFVILCTESTATCSYSGLLYNWFSINNGVLGDGRSSGGIVNTNPAVNTAMWRVPSVADWDVTIQKLDPSANITASAWNNIAGGSMKSLTCWSTPNSGATNSSKFNVQPSVFRAANGIFSLNNGQLGKYWSNEATNLAASTAISYELYSNDDLINKNLVEGKTAGLRLRLVRPADCTEQNGDVISSAYVDNNGTVYNAVVVDNLVWLTSDLKDTKVNTGAIIPNVTVTGTWGIATTGAFCYPDNSSTYTITYATGCQQKKISFANFSLNIVAGGSSLDLTSLQTCCNTNTASINTINSTLSTMQTTLSTLLACCTTKITGTGNAPFLPKWGPTTSTLVDSQFQDNGTSTSIGAVAPATDSKLLVTAAVAQPIALRVASSYAGGSTSSTLKATATGVNAGTNITGDFNASGSTSLNVGVKAVGSAGGTKSYGIQAIAEGGSQKYAIVAQDGTQEAGKFLKSITPDGEANWAFITAADIAGGVIAGSGVTNAVARWLSTTTLGTGLIFDNNSEVSIGNPPVATSMLYVYSPIAKNVGIDSVALKSGGIAGQFETRGTGALTNTGLKGIAVNSTAENIGVHGVATFSTAGNNIGIKSEASGGASNFAIQLKDGSETSIGGKFLKDTGDGKARWTTITAADISGTVTTPGGNNNFVTKFTPNGTTIGNSQIQDDGATVGVARTPVAGTRFSVEGDSTITIAINGKATKNGGIGVEGVASGFGVTANNGIKGTASNSSVLNVGVLGSALTFSPGINIGGAFSATLGASNYAIQLVDGTETTLGGKFLKDTGSGKANWTTLTIADVTGAVGGAGTPDYLPIWTSASALGNSPIFTSNTGSIINVGTGFKVTNATGTFESIGASSNLKFDSVANSLKLTSLTGTLSPTIEIASTNGSPARLKLTRQNTTGSLLINNTIGVISFGIQDSITCTATENHSGTASGRNLKFYTVPNATNAVLEAIELTHDGYLKVASTYRLPRVDGAVGQTLITNGSGILTWGTQANAIVGTTGQMPLFTATNTITSSSNFTFVNNPTVEVGYRIQDGLNNLTQLGISYLNVETEGISQDSALRLANWGDGVTKGAISFRKSRGTKALPEPIVANDKLGVTLYTGQALAYDGDAGIFSPVGTTVGVVEVVALEQFDISGNFDGLGAYTRSALSEYRIYLAPSLSNNMGVSGFPNDLVFSVNGDGAVKFKNYVFPIADGLNNQVLATNGLGTLSWVTPASSGGGLTGGTLNYLSRWTSATTLGIGTVRDDGNAVGINIAPNSEVQLFVSTAIKTVGFAAYNTRTGGSETTGITTLLSGSNTENIGVISQISGGTKNVGIKISVGNGLLTGTPAGYDYGVLSAARGTQGNIGGYFFADSTGTSRHAVRLSDGTEGLGKVLKSVTNDGHANWGYPTQSVQLACTDLTSQITASVITKKAYWIAPCDGYILDVFADVDVAQSSGATIDIDIKKSGSSIFSTRVSIENTQTSSLTAALQPVLSSGPRTFTKGQKYDIFLYTVDPASTARGLLVSINYERRS
jgi:uncharacterized protein (TIGR02145 family)